MEQQLAPATTKAQAAHMVERAIVLILVIVPFVGLLIAINQLWEQYVTWRDIGLMVGMYFFSAIGITIGYHRLLTHRSFETNPVIRFLFLMFGSMAAEGPALHWASIHIQHHATTDTEEDPHSPMEGFFHAHMGWFVSGYVSNPQVYGKWLLKDKLVVFMSKTFMLWVALGLVVCYLIGGWQGVLWGGLVRMFFTHHVTWSVNSVCHLFGDKMFDTDDMSRNNFIVGLLAMGEGWHNNHHAFPRSAFHGMRWWQIDISSYVIRTLEALGLAWNVHRISPKAMEARLNRRDGKARNVANASGD